jgi:hypothetical protein
MRYYDRDGKLTRRVLHNIYPAGNPLNVLRHNLRSGRRVLQPHNRSNCDARGAIAAVTES